MPFLAISLVSAGAIGYEILLMRLYAIGQWHHSAYMIISIALLGYGRHIEHAERPRDAQYFFLRARAEDPG